MKLSWQGRYLKIARCWPRREYLNFRQYSVKTIHSNAGPEATTEAQARLARINSRIPKFLRGYTTPLVNAPLSHISAFLVLHELTAILPLFALAGTFHYTQWMPSMIGEWQWAADGAQKFGRYFRKKGWLAEGEGAGEQTAELRGGNRASIVLEFAAAYAICKALLPLRLMLSVWCTPWFARVAIIPGKNLLQGVFWRTKKS